MIESSGLVVAVIENGLSLWRVNTINMDRLHADNPHVRPETGGFRARMASLEELVDGLGISWLPGIRHWSVQDLGCCCSCFCLTVRWGHSFRSLNPLLHDRYRRQADDRPSESLLIIVAVDTINPRIAGTGQDVRRGASYQDRPPIDRRRSAMRYHLQIGRLVSEQSLWFRAVQGTVRRHSAPHSGLTNSFRNHETVD